MFGVATVSTRSASTLLLLGVVFLLVALVPSGADACAVCFGNGEDDWTSGFVAGTILMLALPPAIVAGAGFTIYRAIKKQEAVEAEAEAHSAASRPAEG